ncbi:uncharacterized protein LOC131951830 [Physella acuta]|uniref:uncharacterized protein LOC131951830 n=1 Tax=Physella acuta TaxID=109671 RepID=UPI0027DC7A46|nr:uncharacterized protein LOC131951830 [Physella acuta]XP_059170212.1 uncharacterized protein LOC131951830 [Physella acuta]
MSACISGCELRDRLYTNQAMANCQQVIHGHPRDMTYIPICPRPQRYPSTKNPDCACPRTEPYRCCCMPGVIETRIVRRPVKCVKPPCCYSIPAIPCNDPPKSPKPPKRDPLCFDWSVEEPGINDSYGLRGLNWYDWTMGKTKVAQPVRSNPNIHPGLDQKTINNSMDHLICRLPLMCYARHPAPCHPAPFAGDVNYFRDWRCCDAKPPPAWKPPYAHWATNQHL